MTPRVSVVTSVYNGEPYFDRAIPGILGQTLEDFELIVVDDGSADGTLERLQRPAREDRRVRVFSPGPMGAAAAYNYGVEQATGEYIARQDFDDRSYPNRLRLQSGFLDAHPGVGVVGGAYVLVDERRGERYVRMPPTNHETIILTLARYVPIAHTTAMYRHRAWSEAGGYPLVNILIDLASISGSRSSGGASRTCPKWWASTTCTTKAGSIARSGTWSASATWRGSRPRRSVS